jgi:hypothetical protein
MTMDGDAQNEIDKRKGILALMALVLPLLIIALVIERPVMIAPDEFNFVRGVFPSNPLLTIACAAGIMFFVRTTWPRATELLIIMLSSPKALKISLILCLGLGTVASTGFFHAVAAASTRVENEAGSWYEGINVYISAASLIIQTILTYRLYVMTKEQTRQSINQSAAAAATNTMDFTTSLRSSLFIDGVPDPRQSVADSLEGLLMAALNGIRMGSSRDLHIILVQLLKNHCTSPLLLVARSNLIQTDKKGKPKCCRCANPNDPEIVQIINMGDSIISRELEGLSIEGRVLDKFDFWGALIKDFSFRNCSLRNVYLIRGTFVNADFRGADLTGAVFIPTADDRNLAAEYEISTLPDDQLFPTFIGNCLFQGATMNRDLFEYLTQALGETALANVTVN